MMKKATTFLLTLLISAFAFGQETNWEEVVYLKDGSIMRGTIIEQIPNKSIKIQTNDRNVFTFNMDQIEKITKEEIPNDKTIKNKGSQEDPARFSNITEFGGIFAVGKTTLKFGQIYLGGQLTNHLEMENNINQFSFTTINGCQFNRRIFIGFGIGAELGQYSINFPLFFDFRYYILEKKITPLIDISGGYALNWSRSTLTSPYKNEKGGVLLMSQLGMRIYIYNNISWSLCLGYKLQHGRDQLTFTNEIGQNIGTSMANKFSHFLTLKTGFVF